MTKLERVGGVMVNVYERFVCEDSLSRCEEDTAGSQAMLLDGLELVADVVDDRATTEEVVERWRRQVCERSDDVDPGNEHDWQSLWIGLCIGMRRPDLANYSTYMKHGFPLERSDGTGFEEGTEDGFETDADFDDES